MEAIECSATAPTDDRQPAKGRSKLSNSLFAVAGLSGNSKAGRRFRDVCKAALVELGSTEHELSALQIDQVRSLGLLQIRLEALEARAFAGDTRVEVDLAINRLYGTISRQRWILGIGRRRRESFGSDESPLAYAERLKGGA